MNRHRKKPLYLAKGQFVGCDGFFRTKRKVGYNMKYNGNKIEGLEITITEDMIKDGLKGYDLIIYALIKDLTRDGDAIFSPDAREVAECLNITTKLTMESLRNLVRWGFIDKEVMKAGNKLLAYEYRMPEDETRRKFSRTTVTDVDTHVSVTTEKLVKR